MEEFIAKKSSNRDEVHFFRDFGQLTEHSRTYTATVHEESPFSGQLLSRKVQQMGLGHYAVVQVERPLWTEKGKAVYVSVYS